MKKESCSIEKVGIRYGLYLAGGLIFYFLIMKLLGLEKIMELRFLNLFILIAAVVTAIQYYKRNCVNLMSYFKGMGVGILTSMIGAAVFAIFMGFYLGVLDRSFLEYIKGEWSGYDNHINPFSLSFIILLEGAISGFFTTFISMQYLKLSHAENPTE